MAILTFGILFAFVTYNEITKDVVIIEPFEVPEDAGKKRLILGKPLPTNFSTKSMA